MQVLPPTAWLLLFVVVWFMGIHRLRRSLGEPVPIENTTDENVSGEKYELGGSSPRAAQPLELRA